MSATHADAFDLLCYGKKLGSGSTRDVFTCRFRPEWVVKVEIEKDWRTFENAREYHVWQDFCHVPAVAAWLAPCEMISPDGHILIQHRADPLPRDYPLPEKLPAFLTDIKADNFGLINGRFVCIDYALITPNISTRERSVTWY